MNLGFLADTEWSIYRAYQDYDDPSYVLQQTPENGRCSHCYHEDIGIRMSLARYQ